MASMRHSRIREVQDLAVNEQLELRDVISGCSLETIFTPTTWGNGHKYDVLNIGCLSRVTGRPAHPRTPEKHAGGGPLSLDRHAQQPLVGFADWNNLPSDLDVPMFTDSPVRSPARNRFRATKLSQGTE